MNSREPFNSASTPHGNLETDKKIDAAKKIPEGIKNNAPVPRPAPGGNSYWDSIREEADRQAREIRQKYQSMHRSEPARKKDMHVPANDNDRDEFLRPASNLALLAKTEIEHNSDDWKMVEHMATGLARGSRWTKEKGQREIYNQFQQQNGKPFHQAMYDQLPEKPEHQRWLYSKSTDTYYINDKNDKNIVSIEPTFKDEAIEAQGNSTLRTREFGDEEMRTVSHGFDLETAKDVGEKYAEAYLARQKEHEQINEQSNDHDWER